MVIVQHFSGSVKAYCEASVRGHIFPVSEHCPDCRASGCLIRWGTYKRRARTGEIDYLIRIQRVRCKECGRTHSLLPDFLHPHRHFVTQLLQQVVSLHLITGLGWHRLLDHLDPEVGPGCSTIREWSVSFAYGAGHLLSDLLTRQLLALDPLSGLPDVPLPQHFQRVPHPDKRRLLEAAHRFYLHAEQLYALLKSRLPQLHFAAEQLFPFLLHWLQNRALPPRLFWNPALATTPTAPF
jgi:hypothetical protein